MNYFKRLLVVCAYSVTVVFSGLAQTTAKYAGEFLAIGVGGRALGMGGAYTALASDATAGYWNPAGVVCAGVPTISAMHDERYAGLVNYDFIGAAIPYSSQAGIGLSILRLGVDGIPDTRQALIDQNGNGQLDPGERIDYTRVTSFNSADWAFYFTYAQQWSDNVSFGINVKLIRRSLAEFTATGLGADIGLLYRLSPTIILGANVQDVTTTLVAWSTGRKELITPTLKLGAAANVTLFGLDVTPAIGADVRAESRAFAAIAHVGPFSIDPAAGVEVLIEKTVAVRAGFSDIQQATMGAGLHLTRLDIDYSFTGFTGSADLGATHRISLGLRIPQGDNAP